MRTCILTAIGFTCVILMLAACGGGPVKPDELRKAELSWPSVTETVDGKAVSDITGYRLEIVTPAGMSPVSLPPDATKHTLIAPTAGGYSFRLIAISASLGESDVSNTVSKVFVR